MAMVVPSRGRAPPSGRQVDDEEVHRASRDERPGHRQGLVQGGRLEDDQPLEADPTGDRLDRVEAPGEVHVGDDRAGGLGLRREPEGEGGLAARGVSPDGQGGRARDPARAEDRVQRGEPGPDDPIVVREAGPGRRSGSPGSSGSGVVASAPTTAPDPPGPPSASRPTRGAASPQRVRRDARAAVTSEERVAIGRLTIEQMFYRVKGRTNERAHGEARILARTAVMSGAHAEARIRVHLPFDGRTSRGSRAWFGQPA